MLRTRAGDYEKIASPGAVAVCILSHTGSDLILPVDAREKRQFEAIDGKRTIDEIVQSTAAPTDARQRARSFFERLWQYDQVIFDASKKISSAPEDQLQTNGVKR